MTETSNNDIYALTTAEGGGSPLSWRLVANVVLSPFFAIGWAGGMSWWTITMFYKSFIAGFRRGAAPKLEG